MAPLATEGPARPRRRPLTPAQKIQRTGAAASLPLGPGAFLSARIDAARADSLLTLIGDSMSRTPAPCGTYPAYRRHLRKAEPVDAACTRAQRDHDADRNRAQRDQDRPVAQLPPHQRSLKDLAEDARAAVLGKAQALVDAAEHDDVYGFIDREAELDDLVEAWCGALDEIERAAGWPNLPPDVRAKVLAAEEVL